MKSNQQSNPSSFLTFARALAVALMLCVGGLNSALAQDYQDGYDAFLAGNYETALQTLLPLAEAGNARAQAVVGFMYLQGRGVPADAQIAARWYLSASQKGDARAQRILGLMYAEGTGVPQNPREALRYQRLAAEQGNADAQYELGFLFTFGDERVAQDFAVAFKWLQLAAAQDNAAAQELLANAYHYERGVATDPQKAAFWYRKAAEQGRVSAQYSLGVIYLAGDGVPRDAVQAAKWLRLAGEQGDAGAQYQLGYQYSQGDGVPQSWPQAVQWFLLAAEQGKESAQFSLGYIFRFGQEGVDTNHETSVLWYRRAAEQGNASAQDSLGFAYNLGRGVPQDYALAATWYRLAAEQGEGSSQYSLGQLYRYGRGVYQDPVKAGEWYRKAAEQGHAKAQLDLGFMLYHGIGLPVDHAEAARLYLMAAKHGNAVAQSKLAFMYEFGQGVWVDTEESAKWYRMAEEQGITYVPERSLAIWQSELSWREHEYGGVSYEVLEPLLKISEIFSRDLGFMDSAYEAYKHGFQISEQVLGPAHTTTLEFLGGYTVGETGTGRYDIALGLARDLLARKQITLGPTDEGTLKTMGLISRILERTGNVTEANQVIQEGLAVALQVYGADAWIVTSNLGTQVMTVDTANPSSILLNSLRNYADQSEKDLGLASLKTLDVKENYANALVSAGLHLDAVEVWADIISGQEERLLLAAVLDNTTRGVVIHDAKHAGRELVEQAWAAQLSHQDAVGLINFRNVAYTLPELDAALAADAFYAAQLGETETAEAVARSMVRLLLRDAGLQRVFMAYEAAQTTVIDFGDEIKALVGQSAAGDGAANTRILALQDLRATAIENVRNLAADFKVKFPRAFEILAPLPVSLADVTGGAGASALLGPNEALILLTPPRGNVSGFVWAVSRDHFAWAEIARSEADLRSDIQYLHALLDPSVSQNAFQAAAANRGAISLNSMKETTSTRPFDRDFAYDLYVTLLGAPDIQNVIARKSEWIIAPQGMFLSLPFAPLVMDAPEGGSARDGDPAFLRETAWLGTRRALSVLPAVSSLRALRGSGASTGGTTENPFFGLGDPDFARASSTRLVTQIGEAQLYQRSGVADANQIAELARLPGTRVEIERLAAAFGASENAVLLGHDASESGLAKAQKTGLLQSSRVIVLATHGLMAGAFDTLGEPALAMTPPICGPAILNPEVEQSDARNQVCSRSKNRAELEAAAADGAWIDDGLLTASEVTQLNLNADWVILSACDTAAGDDQNPDAEGLSGLARSFFFAGARSLLVSHWPVRDDVAAMLTPDAVARARDINLSQAEALRQAMIEVMNNTRLDASPRSFAHPTAWAPFQVTGVNADGA
jgi:TPR repeat protein/CHAT domain-containing protein